VARFSGLEPLRAKEEKRMAPVTRALVVMSLLAFVTPGTAWTIDNDVVGVWTVVSVTYGESVPVPF